MPTDVPFAAWLKRKRREQGLTQETLAGLVGCSTDYLKKIEAGRRQPTRQIVDGLLYALQVPQEAQSTIIALAFASPAPPMSKPELAADLPILLTSFIGRENELAAVGMLLRRKAVRLVTLTGPGGVGKTRLALETATDALDEFEDGVHFVDLAPITNPELVATTIADALGIRVQGTRSPLDTLKDTLRDQRVLLVLDNFEQILAAATVVSHLLRAAPRLKVLVTSRVPLRVRGEQEFAVPPLTLPDPLHLPPLEMLTQYAAVELFTQRVVSVKADFALTDANAPAVAAICYRLDGLPLAIELAAARVKVFPPPVLLQRLDSRLKTLTVGARDAPARQQTLRDAIAWSYDLLTEAEQTLFRRLGVFVGGFTLEAAEAVCNAGADLDVDVVDGVASLVDNSLLPAGREEAGALRFTMLETIREYALEQLAASGEAESVHRKHAGYCLTLAETAEPQLAGPQQARWLHRLAAEQDNLRAAQSWTLANNEVDWPLRFVGALWRFWFFRGDLREGSSFAEEALRHVRSGTGTATYAKALWATGWLTEIQDHLDRAIVYAQMSVQIFMELGDRKGAADALHLLALIVTERGDLTRAYSLHQETLALFQAIHDERGATFARNGLGVVAAAQGDYATARAHFEQSAAVRRRLNDNSFLAYSLGWLALASVRLGDLAAARAALEEGVEVRRELGDEGGLAASLEGLAAVAAAEGKADQAARLFGAAERVRERVGNSLPSSEMGEYRYNVEVARSQMAGDEFAAAWAAGRAMSLEDAVGYALNG